MKMTKIKRILSLVLCTMLIAAIALVSIGCNDNDDLGCKTFTFSVTHSDGSEKEFKIESPKKTVGEALTDEELITVEDGMVVTADGETVRFEDGGKYWAFYIDGKYAMSGVNTTEIVAGSTYSLKVE